MTHPIKKINGFFLFLLIVTQTIAQKTEESLNQWLQFHPIEKIYLHFDRNIYIAGETAWFKAYLSADYLPDTSSTTLYVELLHKDQRVVDRKILPVLSGTSVGQLEIPDSLPSGFYTIRAYTPFMTLFKPDFIYKKGIFVYGKGQEISTPVADNILHLHFFPEGGNLVAGLNGTIAFKATDAFGLPVDISGVIKNSQGTVQCSFSSYHDGMGMFDLKPEAGEKYYAETKEGRFELPEVQTRGITLTVIPHPQGFFFEIQQKTHDPDFIAAFMIGQMQHRIVLRLDFNTNTISHQGVINTQNLMSGVLQLTVFNKNGLPLAERLCFVNNREYILPAMLLEDTINFSPRSRNRFRIALPDTVQGSLSVSVTDADYTTSAEENIITSLLLTSDLSGYVHRPYYYFSTHNEDSVKTATDLLMMTHGWRRFKWTELKSLPALTLQKHSFIFLQGRATFQNTNKPFANKTLLLLIKDGVQKMGHVSYFVKTDSDGNFIIDSLIFFDKKHLLFIDPSGKKRQNINIMLKDDYLHKTFVFRGFTLFPGITPPFSKDVNKKWQDQYEFNLKEKGLLLEEVKVKVQKKTPLQLLDEKYTSGSFSGDAIKSIDLVNTDEALNYNNIFDYLQNRVNGLQIVMDGNEYGVYYRQGPTISSMGNIPMTIFLDEVETDASVVASIPANQVALVKIFNTFAGAWGNAPGGVLAIYTRKGEDLKVTSQSSNTIVYNGYSIIKEFYSPDYRRENTGYNPDNRITLEWRPSVFVNHINPHIPISFYNNDRTRRFRVVVEGMTATGKLIYFEKVFSKTQ